MEVAIPPTGRGRHIYQIFATNILPILPYSKKIPQFPYWDGQQINQIFAANILLQTNSTKKEDPISQTSYNTSHWDGQNTSSMHRLDFVYMQQTNRIFTKKFWLQNYSGLLSLWVLRVWLWIVSWYKNCLSLKFVFVFFPVLKVLACMVVTCLFVQKLSLSLICLFLCIFPCLKSSCVCGGNLSLCAKDKLGQTFVKVFCSYSSRVGARKRDTGHRVCFSGKSQAITRLFIDVQTFLYN